MVNYPNRVVRAPSRFLLPAGEAPSVARDRLTSELMDEARKRSFTYTRSDGSLQTLTVADVIQRRSAMEMAYNPNDCPEIRWGAPSSSAEFKPCTDRRPDDQTERMLTYRQWFRDRRRPVR